jgi:hypothetical protein
LAAAVAVVPLHNLVDFSLAGSGVALPWAVLVGWSIALLRQPAPPAGVPRGRPAATLTVALALAVAAFHATSVTVLEAAAGRERPEEQFDGALIACRLAPWRIRPLELLAVSGLASRSPALIEAADNKLGQARWLRPHAAALADLRGRLALAQGHAPSAVAEAWSAERSNPGNPVYGERLAELVEWLRGGGAEGR